MPQGQLGTGLRAQVQGDLEEVLRHEGADALLQVSQHSQSGRLHAAEAPRLPESRRAQAQRDGPCAVQAEVVVLILPAQRFEVGGVVALARTGLLGQGREGAPNRDIIERAEIEPVDPSAPAEVL